MYFEGRGPLTGSPGFLAGLHRHVDARFALLDPVTFALRGTSQISKYPISAAADLSNGEDQSDIAEVSAGTGVRAVNDKGNGPNSGAGKIPFIGDYTAAIATVDWVLEDGRWRSAYKKGDLPYPGFRAVFADSRNLIPPPGTDAQQIAAYPNFTPVGLPNCANPGTRNHDVEHVLVNASVILDVPTTFKFLGVIQRAFPFSLINGQAFEQFFRIDLVPDDGVQASFSQGTSATTLTDIQTRMFVDLIRYSSTTRVIYMASQIPTGSTRIDVYQVSAIGDTGGTLVGSSRLNLDPTNTSTLSATSETHTVSVSPLVTSPLVTSPLVTSTGAGSTMVANPLVTSPLVTSPLVTSSAYQDFTWTVSGGSDMVNSAMVAQVFVDKANSQQTSKSYKFELRIHKRAAHLGINGCTSGPAADEQLISSIFIDTAAVNTDDPTATPLVTSPLVTSPLVTSPLVTSPLVTSSTFSMSPPDTTSTSGGTTASVTAEAAATSDDGTLQDKLDNRVFITLRAYLNKSIDPTKAPKLATPNIRVEPLSRDVIPDPNNPGQFILR